MQITTNICDQTDLIHPTKSNTSIQLQSGINSTSCSHLRLPSLLFHFLRLEQLMVYGGFNHVDAPSLGEAVALEEHMACHQRENGVVLAHPHVLPRVKLCTALPHDYVARDHSFPEKRVNTEGGEGTLVGGARGGCGIWFRSVQIKAGSMLRVMTG